MRTLLDFPEAYQPLVVVVGDRREHRPKTRADLLAYPVSTVDVLYINSLGLPRDTLVLADKIFLLEEPSFLRNKFAKCNILTIGSPAANLFSRMINEESLFRFRISPWAWSLMRDQEQIVDKIKRDRMALRMYKLIVEEGAQTIEEIQKDFHDKMTIDERTKKTFETLLKEINNSGLNKKGYKALLHEFEGRGIVDPIVGGQIDFTHAHTRGEFRQDWNDFGLLSLARHPYAESDDFVVIYAAGYHGPATSHSIRRLANKEGMKGYPLGGVFTVEMDTASAYSTRFQEVTCPWDTDPYSLGMLSNFKPNQLRAAPLDRSVGVFISAPFRSDDPAAKIKTEWLAQQVVNYFIARNIRANCTQPYNLPNRGEWNYVNGILKYFPSAQFILHDVTEFSPGVMFEVGCSIGFNRKLLLLWDKSKTPFEAERLSTLLKFTNVLQLDFSHRKQTKAALDKAFSDLSPDIKSTGGECPGLPRRVNGERCHFRFDESPSFKNNHVFIVIPDRFDELRKKVIEHVRRFNAKPVLPSDAPTTMDVSLCRMCWGIATCGHVIVDVSENHLDGLLALGMSRARERHTFQLLKEGSQPCSMFDGPTKAWRQETLEVDLNNGFTAFLGGHRPVASP